MAGSCKSFLPKSKVRAGDSFGVLAASEAVGRLLLAGGGDRKEAGLVSPEDGYISASDIEDDEEEEAEEAAEAGHVLGSENTAAFRSIIVKRVLSVQAQQPEKLQRHNLFQIFFVINNRRARVIIDGGSCNNLVSSDLGKKLGLATRPHPHPYHIQWLNDAGKAKVTQSCRVSFSIVAMLIM